MIELILDAKTATKVARILTAAQKHIKRPNERAKIQDIIDEVALQIKIESPLKSAYDLIENFEFEAATRLIDATELQIPEHLRPHHLITRVRSFQAFMECEDDEDVIAATKQNQDAVQHG